MAKHMGIDERKRIELLLGLRWTAAEITREMGRRESTMPCVCNGCEQLQACPLAKKLYVASAAQANYGSVLSESRRGVTAKDGRIAEMNRVLAPCILRGQSIRHVMASNPDVFRGVGERSVYRYVEERLFDVTRGDLPEACKRKAKGRQSVTKTHARHRVGRTYRERGHAQPGTPRKQVQANRKQGGHEEARRKIK